MFAAAAAPGAHSAAAAIGAEVVGNHASRCAPGAEHTPGAYRALLVLAFADGAHAAFVVVGGAEPIDFRVGDGALDLSEAFAEAFERLALSLREWQRHGLQH